MGGQESEDRIEWNDGEDRRIDEVKEEISLDLARFSSSGSESDKAARSSRRSDGKMLSVILIWIGRGDWWAGFGF